MYFPISFLLSCYKCAPIMYQVLVRTLGYIGEQTAKTSIPVGLKQFSTLAAGSDKVTKTWEYIFM